MELADILAEHAVLTCTGVRDKRHLFELLSQKGAELTGFPAETILEVLMAREELGSTGLGNGIAIPHGKVSGLQGVTAVFARLDEAIEFDAVDDQPVDIVVMLLAPVGAGADHLKALSRVARILRTESVVDQLRAENDADRLHVLLTEQLEEDAA
ncbi:MULTISPECIES: PTS sugar transporter subunit IIA [unclassified Devosia]|uniref:PTS sugar transporter subunit IIA n=1 Tax=unclassified Devosia TaxID=196773 RepID=UPI00145E4ECA|nr:MULTISPECIES: PTS sugar transporter subunit IIA [unclassified Devosia]MBJ6987120.1 PTS sugar transporter subunit IIA [Devosia sp. MC521]MBJ7577316.1 PTS sugar transporter subunit IIA [Devosia sp. MC532]MBK1795135.1 PTS sugar transporter subunit IIA [Devosia sp. WQ 349K1]QMW62739.1 PTS sugar transporter subunit IIA [Devosia sp. MC521]